MNNLLRTMADKDNPKDRDRTLSQASMIDTANTTTIKPIIDKIDLLSDSECNGFPIERFPIYNCHCLQRPVHKCQVVPIHNYRVQQMQWSILSLATLHQSHRPTSMRLQIFKVWNTLHWCLMAEWICVLNTTSTTCQIEWNFHVNMPQI